MSKTPITIKPTHLIIPGPVRQWLAEEGYSYQDVLDVVASAYEPLRLSTNMCCEKARGTGSTICPECEQIERWYQEGAQHG